MTAVVVAGTLGFVPSITDRIRLILETRGWSQRELSRRSGLAEVHVSKLLQRGAERAGSETLAALARGAGVNLTWLLTGEGEPWEGPQPQVLELQPGPEAVPELRPVLSTIPNWRAGVRLAHGEPHPGDGGGYGARGREVRQPAR